MRHGISVLHGNISYHALLFLEQYRIFVLFERPYGAKTTMLWANGKMRACSLGLVGLVLVLIIELVLGLAYFAFRHTCSRHPHRPAFYS